MLAKEHQPQRLQDGHLVFADPPEGDDHTTAQAVDSGHDRNPTTLDVHAHAIPANLTNAVAALERAIAGA